MRRACAARTKEDGSLVALGGALELRQPILSICLLMLDSARRHGISDADMLAVISEPFVVAELRDESEKLLFLGLGSKARALEVITDTGTHG